MSNIEPDYDTLDDGIRETVRALWRAGFVTCDSGDGSKAETMECALEYPHVFMVVPRDHLLSEADRLHRLVLEWLGSEVAELLDLPEGAPIVEASYSPADRIGILSLIGVVVRAVS